MEDRTPLLLLPGLLCDEALWQAQISDLADVADIAIADTTRDDSVGGMARRALALMEARGNERFALCGLSMGGFVALEIMRQAPGRVTRLGLLDTSARPIPPEEIPQRRAFMAMVRQGQFRGVTPRLLPTLIHPSRLTGPVAAAVQAMAERVGRDAFLRQQEAIIARPDSRPSLPVIRVPTLVGVGDADVRTPPALAQEMAALIPGAQLVRFEGCGHLPTMEVPVAVNEALRAWLRC